MKSCTQLICRKLKIGQKIEQNCIWQKNCLFQGMQVKAADSKWIWISLAGPLSVWLFISARSEGAWRDVSRCCPRPWVALPEVWPSHPGTTINYATKRTAGDRRWRYKSQREWKPDSHELARCQVKFNGEFGSTAHQLAKSAANSVLKLTFK